LVRGNGVFEPRPIPKLRTINRRSLLNYSVERMNKSFFQVGRVLVSRAGKVGSTVNWQKRCQICT